MTTVTTECYILMLVQVIFTLIQSHWEAKAAAQFISLSSQSIRVEHGLLLRLVHLMNCILMLFHLMSIQGRGPYLWEGRGGAELQ